MNPLDRLTALGTSVWVDALVEPMELARLVERDAVTGLTSNPTILDRAMTGGADYATRAALFANVMSPRSLFDALVITDMQALADVLAPVYRRTDGLDGYVSLEVPPDLAYDADATVASARDLWTRLDRPNAMIKIPATAAGIDATARVIADGINVNATLLFSVQAYAAVIEAYMAGLETRLRLGQSIDRIASVASFFVSRIDSAVDPRLRSGGRFDLQGLAGVASAHRAYDLARERFASDRFASLQAHGARPQRPLWASTGTKDPRYSDVKYVEELAGPRVVNTMPLATLAAFRDHGNPSDHLSEGATTASAALEAIAFAGVDLYSVTHRLLQDGVAGFAASMNELLESLDHQTPIAA
jgi:transaldolase